MNDLQPKLPSSEIAAQMKELHEDEMWGFLFSHFQAFYPLWMEVLKRWGDLGKLSKEKREFHIRIVEEVPQKLDDWRFQRIKLIKARRKEVDSTISFIWNSAVQNPYRHYLLAPHGS